MAKKAAKGGPAKSARKAIPRGVKRTSTGKLTKRK
jgi:hypothetical protein